MSLIKIDETDISSNVARVTVDNVFSSKYYIYKIINFINKNPSFRLKNWLSINNKNLLKKKVPEEIYLPRLVYSFYLEDKILEILKNKIKKKIKISFYQGNLGKIKFEKNQ